MPLGLKKWVDLLAPKKLPVMATSLRALKLQMANPQLALVDYASPILDDPALAIQLLKKANQDRQSANRDPLTTLGNALSHLGRGQLEQQLAQIHTLDQLGLSDQYNQGYTATVAAACHGANLAQDWAQQRKIHEPGEMQLAALLQYLAEMVLWCHGGTVMLDIESRCYGQRQDYDKAAEQVLGCSIRALSAELAKAWAQPELAVQALEVKVQDYTLATGVMLATRLARLVQHSWYDRAARLCLDNIARYKGHSLSEIEPQIHLHAVALSDHFMALGYLPPARLLPMMVDEDYVDPQFIAGKNQELLLANSDKKNFQPEPDQSHKPFIAKKVEVESVSSKVTEVKLGVTSQTIESVEDKITPPQALNEERIKNHKQQIKPELSPELANKLANIKIMLKQHVHASELIQAVVEAIELSGFERVVFAVKVPQEKLLYGRFFSQQNTDRAFKVFSISIAQPNLFSLLMNKSQHLWVNDDNRGKYWNRVPDAVKLMLQNDSFMAMSIFTHKHSVGLMYADRSDGKLTVNEYKRFQGLCRLLVDGMVEISHHHGK